MFEEHAEEIFDEAENRLHAQKAVMYLLMGRQGDGGTTPSGRCSAGFGMPTGASTTGRPGSGNSLPAFRRAMEHGYGVELDVHLTGDGRLAVIHDKNLKRTAGVDAEVSSLSAAELKNFRLEGTGETIPLLEEVLPMFQGGPPFWWS